MEISALDFSKIEKKQSLTHVFENVENTDLNTMQRQWDSFPIWVAKVHFYGVIKIFSRLYIRLFSKSNRVEIFFVYKVRLQKFKSVRIASSPFVRESQLGIWKSNTFAVHFPRHDSLGHFFWLKIILKNRNLSNRQILRHTWIIAFLHIKYLGRDFFPESGMSLKTGVEKYL